MKPTHLDNLTILAYFEVTQRACGYKGLCFINTTRLAQLHLDNSIAVANAAIAKAMVA